jgi:ferric-dicitrate binding protein FerR (iron transport regulator)
MQHSVGHDSPAFVAWCRANDAATAAENELERAWAAHELFGCPAPTATEIERAVELRGRECRVFEQASRVLRQKLI